MKLVIRLMLSLLVVAAAAAAAYTPARAYWQERNPIPYPETEGVRGEVGAVANVEWQVRRNLTVSSKFGGQGDASLSIRWRRQSRQPGTGREDRRPNR